jgi:hypothetical protein
MPKKFKISESLTNSLEFEESCAFTLNYLRYSEIPFEDSSKYLKEIRFDIPTDRNTICYTVGAAKCDHFGKQRVTNNVY